MIPYDVIEETHGQAATARIGTEVQVKARSVAFSFWPMFRTTRRYGLQSTVFASNPWSLMSIAVENECSPARQSEALACLVQSEQFFSAAESAAIWASKPLLLYYSFMNAAKALCLTREIRTTFDQAQHGITPQRRGKGRELLDVDLQVFQSPNAQGHPNVFADFLNAVGGQTINQTINYRVTSVFPQILPGHRLWCQAAGKRERFIAIEDVDFFQNHATGEMWLRFHLFSDDLTRLKITRKALLDESGLAQLVREVTSGQNVGSKRRLLRFEEIQTTRYGHRPSDKVPDAVGRYRSRIWTAVTSVPPYRKYYLYLCPKAERQELLPQVLSIYALTYYLGSVTRYRPQEFDALLSGEYGEQIQEVLTSVPRQFLYLLASDFAKRDVTRAALV